jgi:flagellin
MLTRMKELATQAASANAGSNLDKINAEGNKLIDEIDRIANSTKYAGTNLLNGSFGVTLSTGTWTVTAGRQSVYGMASDQTYNAAVVSTAAGVRSMTISATLSGGARYSETIYGLTAPGVGSTKEVAFNTLGLTVTLNSSFAVSAGTIVSHTATASNFQVGTSSSGNDKIGILIGNVTSAVIANGSALSKDQLTSAAAAQTLLDTLNTAISYLSGKRGDIGAAQNRLSYATANLASTIENFTAADSVIRDVDMAAEMTSFTKSQILLQAGTAMLAQANSAPQQILSLFK